MADRRRLDIVRWIESLIKSNSDNRLLSHIRSKITWNRVFRVVSYTKSSLWIVPIIAILLQQIAVRVLHVLDTLIVWPFEGVGLKGAETMLQTIITLTLSFMVFTFGSLLVAIQVASGQMTPRIIATTLLRDNVIRYSVGLFVFTMVFSVATLGRSEITAHQLPLFVAALFGFVSLAAFLYLIDYASRLLRPVSIAARVGEMGLNVIKSVYPQPTKEPLAMAESSRNLGMSERTVSHHGKGEFILALNLEAVITAAKDANAIIEFVPRVGDFIGTEEPLFLVYGDAAEIDDRKLLAAVAFGTERTMEQDPTFSFRILADIALKALSPAINDPTTAVLAIDQLHRLLRLVGQRHLSDDEILDDMGRLRLICRTPNWEDFVHLAFTEIRHCGAGNVQIARRLRAMIENLIHTLPEHRHAALRIELGLLNSMVERYYTLPEDLALARGSDTQGL
ncbi:MAG: DUF2254 domain-containing protein [Syntrophaceae bacterium]